MSIIWNVKNKILKISHSKVIKQTNYTMKTIFAQRKNEDEDIKIMSISCFKFGIQTSSTLTLLSVFNIHAVVHLLLPKFTLNGSQFTFTHQTIHRIYICVRICKVKIQQFNFNQSQSIPLPVQYY